MLCPARCLHRWSMRRLPRLLSCRFGRGGDTAFCRLFPPRCKKHRRRGGILTASLSGMKNHLFFYAEGLNCPFTPLQVFARAGRGAGLPWARSGARQNPARGPPCSRIFTTMYPPPPPTGSRAAAPSAARGRIALLPPDSWCSHMEHHLRIVTEGLVEGTAGISSVCEGVLFPTLRSRAPM